MASIKETDFSYSKKERDKFCQNKDLILDEFFSGLTIKNPSNFFALVMPCLYGKEVFELVNKGVPTKNIFALERDPFVHQEIIQCKKNDRKQLKGLLTTPCPMEVPEGLSYASRLIKQFDLIYLDFFGQPDFNIHYEKIIKEIFSCKLLKDTSNLILTFGETRCTKKTKQSNNRIVKILNSSGFYTPNIPTQAFVAYGIHETGFNKFSSIIDREYISISKKRSKINYMTTIVTWNHSS